jgi:hypothetical protein
MEKLEIHELIGRYYYYVDTQNKEAWLSLWTEEGHLQNGDNIAKGASQLQQFANDHITDPNKHTRHMATNIFVEVNGNQATAINYMLVIDSIVQEAQHATAICHSRISKINGEWKLLSHIFNTDLSFDFSKVKGA